MRRLWIRAAQGLVASLLATITFCAAADTAPAQPQKPVPQVPWKKLPNSERQVLAPLEREWDSMPGLQQRRLIDSARTYPKLAPNEQARYQERIRGWASLTPQQRQQAREKYRDLSTLPPEKQQEIRQRWDTKRSGAETGPAAPPAAPK
ncbi:MAG TPA: DUF3106 domain-containing protein [Usitatibacteraceae bacterium]|nr:DUF3106 domain-containing protein [Usitatibacteraceae bacterium]